MADALAQLQSRLPLDKDAVAFLKMLPAQQQGVLVRAITAAQDTQQQRLEKALDGAIGFIPAPLRGRARKLLFD